MVLGLLLGIVLAFVLVGLMNGWLAPTPLRRPSAIAPQYVFGGPIVYPNATLNYVPQDTLVWTRVVLTQPTKLYQVDLGFGWKGNVSGTIVLGVYVDGRLEHSASQAFGSYPDFPYANSTSVALTLNTAFPAGTLLEVAFASTAPVYVWGYPSSFNQTWLWAHYLQGAAAPGWVPMSPVTFMAPLQPGWKALPTTLPANPGVAQWSFWVDGLSLPSNT